MELQKILIVEDESLVLQDILRIFHWKDAGYEPVTAVNGILGVQAFIKYHPSIVITDIRMPHMDGLEMMVQIRQMAPDTRFVVLSAYDDFEYARQALKLGAFDYILKKDISAASIRKALEALKETDRSPAKEAASPSLSPVIQRAVSYIQENYHDPNLRIGGVSLACDISSSRLSAKFREEMDISVNDYITQVRMEQAKRLLAGKKYRVYEVADMVGYRNSAYFCTVFLEQTGVKPNKYHE